MTEKTIDYKSSINLPQTNFSMKADLVKKEPALREKWAKMNLYEEIRKLRKGKPKYILHDGPPYANGDVHVGTALNKILKDIVVKFKTMQGFDSPYIPGWDCHGLPIEHRVMNQLGSKAREMQKADIRKECDKYARKYIEIQKNQFQALGIFGEWENPYLTLNPEYEAAVIEVFGDLVEKGFVYRKLKPIHWCMNCETVLAAAELEYANLTSPSIYVKFPVDAKQFSKFAISNLQSSISFFVWTTTPWTLPANVAVAFNPKNEYAFVKYINLLTNKEEIIIFAEALVAKVMGSLGVKDYKVLHKAKGTEFEGLAYVHPFVKRTCQSILAEYVSLEDGTGIVHIAPGHGEEDYESGLKYNLPVVSPVDTRGCFTDEAGIFPGEKVFDADPKIVEMLKTSGHLLLKQDITHSYPHCWRCKKPVIFRATEQWFISIDHNDARKKALSEVEKVKWTPQWGKARTASMLQTRPDWCVSRQRNWGVPIPVFYCAKCREPILDNKVIERVKDIFRKEGSMSWFVKDSKEFLPAGIKCKKCSHGEFVKETDILDVWFESGSSFRAVVLENKDLQFPSDLYLEGSDQPVRWFQLSLIPSVMTRGVAPFKNILIHGFVKRPEGEKLSKSKGALSSDEMVKKVGADILRLWLSSVNSTEDIIISLEILGEKGDHYRKIRNTFRYLLGNVYDFNPVRSKSPDSDRKSDDIIAKNNYDSNCNTTKLSNGEKATVSDKNQGTSNGVNPLRSGVPYDDLLEIDKWALSKLYKLIKNVTAYYESFEFHKAYRDIYEFCAVDMSSFYIDVLKDRLYTYGKDSVERRAAQTAYYEILTALVKLIAPILVHTADEIWSEIPGSDKAGSVHLADWPKLNENYINDALEADWAKLAKIKSEASRELDRLRKEKVIGNSLEADVTLFTDDNELKYFLNRYKSMLPMAMIVSQVTLIDAKPANAVQGIDIKELFVSVAKSKVGKCERCWNFRPAVGADKNYPTLCERCIPVVSGK